MEGQERSSISGECEMMLPSERVRQEEALRGGVLAGDAAAWRRLYDHAYAELWAYVIWRCAGLRDLAEEVTQETWLIAVRRIRDFDPQQGGFRSWLRGIAAHVLLNQLRSRRRQPVQSLPELAEPARDVVGQREQGELIARALAELPERSEAVLRAKYLDQMSVEEIAADWGQTTKAIESLLTRARQAFRTAYEGQPGTDVRMKEAKP
jgi:RNA polymerase sigma-70 factor (ECF subfamily)